MQWVAQIYRCLSRQGQILLRLLCMNETVQLWSLGYNAESRDLITLRLFFSISKGAGSPI